MATYPKLSSVVTAVVLFWPWRLKCLKNWREQAHQENLTSKIGHFLVTRKSVRISTELSLYKDKYTTKIVI